MRVGLELGGSCCVVGRRREHGVGPPFLGGTNQGGPGRSIRDDDPRLRQPLQTPSRPTAYPRRPHMGDRPIRCCPLQPQHTLRRADSPRRQGGYPLHCARNPRSRGAHGPCAYRQGAGFHALRHPPNRGRQDRRRVGRGTRLSDLLELRLEQEMRERERVEQELRVARRIQQASLPEEVPTLEGWQINPYYRPAREVGGDFYDFHLLSDGRLAVVVGDATGKGVPAALVMSTTSGMLRLAAQSSSSPGEMLQR